VVLRCRARHRRAADIDVLDRLVERRAFGDRRFERIEIAHQQVDAFDAVCLHCFGMIRNITQCQQSAMNLRVQRLHASVHHLRRTRNLGNIRNGQSGVAQRLRRAAGRDQRRAVFRETLREIDQTGLVGNGKQRAANGAERHGDSALEKYAGSYFFAQK
jgi:hypothetical protein